MTVDPSVGSGMGLCQSAQVVALRAAPTPLGCPRAAPGRRGIDRIGVGTLWPERTSWLSSRRSLSAALGIPRWLKRLDLSVQTLPEWPERAIVVNMSRCGKSSGRVAYNATLPWVAALTAKLETGYKSRILLDLFAFRP